MAAKALVELIRIWARQYGVVVNQSALDDLAGRISGRYGQP